MKSSEGRHYAGLDHIRALASFMVVAWHFTHAWEGNPVPFNQAPWLGLLDEGHAGVALFMVLSGYLFAKLIDGRRFDFSAFVVNRALRLAPLLLMVLIVEAATNGSDTVTDLDNILSGVIRPTLPSGAWSITTEAHFYVLLPLLLWATARYRKTPLALVAVAIAVRLTLLPLDKPLVDFSYWTIVGRIDQFLFGIFFFCHRGSVGGRAALAALAGVAGFYAWFDAAGGFYDLPPRLEWVWVFIPTIEGAAFGALIAWYDERPFRPDSAGMRLVQKAGEYSYSIYLLHGFVVFHAAAFVHAEIMDISTLARALPWALAFHGAMLPIGYLSFRYIELPPMRHRKAYILDPRSASQGGRAETAASTTAPNYLIGHEPNKPPTCN